MKSLTSPLSLSLSLLILLTVLLPSHSLYERLEWEFNDHLQFREGIAGAVIATLLDENNDTRIYSIGGDESTGGLSRKAYSINPNEPFSYWRRESYSSEPNKNFRVHGDTAFVADNVVYIFNPITQDSYDPQDVVDSAGRVLVFDPLADDEDDVFIDLSKSDTAAVDNPTSEACIVFDYTAEAGKDVYVFGGVSDDEENGYPMTDWVQIFNLDQMEYGHFPDGGKSPDVHKLMGCALYVPIDPNATMRYYDTSIYLYGGVTGSMDPSNQIWRYYVNDNWWVVVNLTLPMGKKYFRSLWYRIDQFGDNTPGIWNDTLINATSAYLVGGQTSQDNATVPVYADRMDIFTFQTETVVESHSHFGYGIRLPGLQIFGSGDFDGMVSDDDPELVCVGGQVRYEGEDLPTKDAWTSTLRTSIPTASPFPAPTTSPTATSYAPTTETTMPPTAISGSPTSTPTATSSAPTGVTAMPSVSPTDTTGAPSVPPTVTPSTSPTQSPSQSPSTLPSLSPSVSPTLSPSRRPTFEPTYFPTVAPTVRPTGHTPSPTGPTIAPTREPTHYRAESAEGDNGSTKGLAGLRAENTALLVISLLLFLIICAMVGWFCIYQPHLERKRGLLLQPVYDGDEAFGLTSTQNMGDGDEIALTEQRGRREESASASNDRFD